MKKMILIAGILFLGPWIAGAQWNSHPSGLLPADTTPPCSRLQMINRSVSICSGPFTFLPYIDVGYFLECAALVTEVTTYSWAAPVCPGIKGGVSGKGQAQISGDLTNTTTLPATATYSVTPTVGHYPARPFTLAVTVEPAPNISAQSCTAISGSTFNYSLSSVYAEEYTWAMPSLASGLSGGRAGTNTTAVSDNLINTTAGTLNAVYTVSVIDGCPGSTFTLTVAVSPVPCAPALTPLQGSGRCSGLSFSNNPRGSNIPAGTTYSWAAPVSSAGLITGGAAATGQATINGQLNTANNQIDTAFYIVTPVSGLCPGSPFTYYMAVLPVPNIGSQNVTTCSGVPFSYTPTGVIPGGTSYNWSMPTLAKGLSGGAAASSMATIADNLTNTTLLPLTATYMVTPYTSNCHGVPFTVTVTVMPVASIGALSTSTPGDGNFSYTPTGSIPGGTTYSWGTPSWPIGVFGTIGNSGQTTVHGEIYMLLAGTRDIIFNVTPLSDLCVGKAFPLTVSVRR